MYALHGTTFKRTTTAHCIRQHMYSMFTFFFRQERVQRAQSTSKRSKSLLLYSANDRDAHHLHSDLQKAQLVAAVRSGDFVTPPF